MRAQPRAKRGAADNETSEFEHGLNHTTPGAGASIEIVVVIINPEDSGSD